MFLFLQSILITVQPLGLLGNWTCRYALIVQISFSLYVSTCKFVVKLNYSLSTYESNVQEKVSTELDPGCQRLLMIFKYVFLSILNKILLLDSLTGFFHFLISDFDFLKLSSRKLDQCA